MPQPRELLVLRAVDRVAVGVGVEPGREALDVRVLVERAAAADGVAQPVGERADAGAGQVELRGLHEARVVGDLAEVPALAVEVDALAVDAVAGERQPVELARSCTISAFGWWPMRSKRKPSTLYCVAHVDHRVEQQLAHHPVLGRGVLAAGRRLDRAGGRVEALVVAGDDAIEDRIRVLAGRRRVVVDDVHHHAQAGAVDALDHRAVLARPRAAVRLARVGALGPRVVQRVVAPVEAVRARDRRHARLLLLRRGPNEPGRTPAPPARSGALRSWRCRWWGGDGAC